MTMTELQAVKTSRVATQPGSTLKKWDQVELVKCGAIGTTAQRFLDLRGEIHPVFANWAGVDDAELWRELEQPLLLASRIVESAGLQWLSDFVIEDIFGESYPGREPSHASERTTFVTDENRTAPKTIVRHHRAPWATPEQKRKWLITTQRRLRNEVASSITWQLDADMYPKRGWVGYTCKHPRGNLSLDELDRYETIRKFDRSCRDRRYRDLTVLVTAEYPRRLAELRRRGLAHGEEYLLTAFMTTITILHEYVTTTTITITTPNPPPAPFNPRVMLGHAIYWKDSRSLARNPREPFYGGDLEMELGDSFVAAAFGGWVPVPVLQQPREEEEKKEKKEGRLSFADGLAWRQSLSWDHHRLRPKHRTHYSIPVDYVARLFDEESWFAAAGRPERLIRPYSLAGAAAAAATTAGQPLLHPAFRAQHAAAALPDFGRAGGGWAWRRARGARFRIPQYDGCVCPELDLPTATDDVITEPVALDPRASSSSSSSSTSASSSSSSSMSSMRSSMIGVGGMTSSEQTQQQQSPRRFSLVAAKKRSSKVVDVTGTLPPPRNRDSGVSGMQATTMIKTAPVKIPEEEDIPRVFLGPHHQGQRQRLRQREVSGSGGIGRNSSSSSSNSGSPDRGEISVDELKKRLSRIIGVSLTELEKLFDGPPCG
ncbi:hypothetical protein F4809DRAFT_655194 [Biscogniauxia mediterranea]|nr:hypothetical protein F4809DRAFT_655194 [Biscogniauxia mediterranea]